MRSMIDRRRLLVAGPVLLAAGAAASAAAAQVAPIGPGDMPIGRADAPVQVIEYASLSCSHCADWHVQVWPEFKRRYVDTGRVRFAVREILTEPAQMAAAGFMLARCAPAARYYDALAVLFENQQQIAAAPRPIDAFTELSPRFGVTAAQARACLSDRANLDALSRRLEQNQAAGVNGTPSFAVAGGILAGEQSIEQLAAVIDPLLASGGRGTAARRRGSR